MFHRPKRRYLPGFVPPHPVRAIQWLVKGFSAPVLEHLYGITSVSIRPEEAERFARYQGQRMAIIPNHPTPGDPALLFRVSKLLNEDWLFLSNREQFDRWLGLYGRLLQWCGAYSIARGTMDKASFLTTKAILVENRAKLVVFGEGGTYSWNDSDVPLQESLFKLLLMAAQEMREKQNSEPLWIQPVALKYVFFDDGERKVLEGLSRLETAVGLEGAAPEDFRDRVLRIGTKIVGAVEQGCFGRQFPSDPPHDRIVRVREEMLDRFSQTLGVACPPPESGTLLERTRVLFDAFHRVSLEGLLPSTHYEERLFEEDIRAMRSVRTQLNRLENWMALREGYLLEHLSLSRKVEIVTRLEREVFKGVLTQPKKRCVVRFAEPFDLRQYLPESGKPSKEQTRGATREAEGRIQLMLAEMRL